MLENREDHIGLYLHRISSDNQDFNVSFNSSDISYVSKDCKDFINSSWGGTINIKNLFYPHSLHSDVYVNEKSQLKLNIEVCNNGANSTKILGNLFFLDLSFMPRRRAKIAKYRKIPLQALW